MTLIPPSGCRDQEPHKVVFWCIWTVFLSYFWYSTRLGKLFCLVLEGRGISLTCIILLVGSRLIVLFYAVSDPFPKALSSSRLHGYFHILGTIIRQKQISHTPQGWDWVQARFSVLTRQQTSWIPRITHARPEWIICMSHTYVEETKPGQTKTTSSVRTRSVIVCIVCLVCVVW